MSGNTDFITEGYTIKSYAGKARSVTIPSEIKVIGEEVFRGSSVQNVSFEGTGLKIIQDGAFRHCSNLKLVELPNQLVQIGENAFAECNNLQVVVVPSSVVFIGENAFPVGTNLIIAGDKGSAGEEYAKKNGITFRTDKKVVLSLIKGKDKEAQQPLTKTFTVFGEPIVCTQSYLDFKETDDYYEALKKKTYLRFSAGLHKQFEEFANADKDADESLDEVVEKPRKDIIKRVEKKGVICTEKDIKPQTIPYYNVIVKIVEIYSNAVNKIMNDSLADFSATSKTMMQDAVNNATGLSYGVIGGGADLFLYGLDNLLETRKQLKRNTAQAQQQITQYEDETKKIINKGIEQAWKIVSPKLREAVNNYIDSLHTVENEILEKAGKLDLSACTSYDPKKSEHFARLGAGNDADLRFNIAQALKNDPTNINAYARAINKTCFDDDIYAVATYMGMSEEVGSILEADLKARIKANKDPAAILSLYDKAENKMQEADAASVLSELGTHLYERIVASAQNYDTDLSGEEYCRKELETMLSDEALNALNAHQVKAPGESWKNEDVLSFMLGLRKESSVDEERYNVACKALKEATGRKEFCDVIKQFKQISDYKDSREKIHQAQGQIDKIDEYKQIVLSLTDNPNAEQIGVAKIIFSKRHNDPAVQPLKEYCKQYEEKRKQRVEEPTLFTPGFTTVLVLACIMVPIVTIFVVTEWEWMELSYKLFFFALELIQISIPVYMWKQYRDKAVWYRHCENEVVSTQNAIMREAQAVSISEAFLSYTGGAEPQQPAKDSFAELERIAKLHEEGVLSDAEFAKRKADLLERM